MSYKQFSPIPILQGGTNSISFAHNHGVIIFEGTQQITVDPGLTNNVLTSNGPLFPPTFQALPQGAVLWNNVTTSTQTIAVSNGYISNDTSNLVTFTLPATAAVGDLFEIQGSGTGLWTIAQNAGQTIHFNAVDSTTGVTGTVSSTSRYDSITLLCNVADTDFVVNKSTGNLSVA